MDLEIGELSTCGHPEKVAFYTKVCFHLYVQLFVSQNIFAIFRIEENRKVQARASHSRPTTQPKVNWSRLFTNILSP